MPDPLTEEQVYIQLSWSADEGTRRAIERQAKLMGFDTPTEPKYMTSDHRVAGSSPSGCKIALVNDPRGFMSGK